MARITILGAGISGLAAAAMLARDGHEVTLPEPEPESEPAPDSGDAAWESWSRDGVVQFRQAHYLARPGFGLRRRRRAIARRPSCETACGTPARPRIR